jgi:hypothetical protein
MILLIQKIKIKSIVIQNVERLLQRKRLLKDINLINQKKKWVKQKNVLGDVPL